MIDLRSDTVTRPTHRMLEAMTTAPVGDDVYGDDPTVNSLQDRCAELLGKEAGLFVPTGSMGNLVALGALAQAGEEVVCDPDAHFLNFEGGGVACLGLVVRSLPAVAGLVTADQLAAAARPGDDHSPRTAVVVVENTHTTLQGRVLPLEDVQKLARAGRAAGVALHLDGARIFNAQAATGVAARDWAACADTVTFCFSKGLGAPVGAMVCGSRTVIARAWRLRKRLGGAMRQAGVLAAAAHVALDIGIERLARDHRNAQRLALGLAALAPDAADPSAVETNIVHLYASAVGSTAPELVAALEAEGVRAKAYGRDVVRFVTHQDLDADDVDAALAAFARIVEAL